MYLLQQKINTIKTSTYLDRCALCKTKNVTSLGPLSGIILSQRMFRN